MSVDIKLVPLITTDTSTINAKDYVYLGSGEASFVMDMVATLDKLLFIEGKRRGLVLGMYHKYVKKRKYCCYSAHDITNSSDYLFDTLHINESGKLIGRIKGTTKEYAINIDKNSKTYSSVESIENIRLRMNQ